MLAVAVELLTPSISQQSRGLELGNFPRNGEAVKARVIAMLDSSTARLELLGQTIDVSTPRAFQAGTSISVAAVRDGGSLKLIVHQDAQAAWPHMAGGNAATIRADTAGMLSTTAKAAIIGALLGSASTSQSPGLDAGSSTQGAPAAPAGPEADAQLPVGMQAQQALNTIPQGLDSAGRPQAASSPLGAHGAQHAAALSGAAANPVAQNSAQAILVPFQLPQMTQPVMLKIEQQQEDGEENSGGPAAKRAWTVNVSLDAGPLGLVHIGIGFRQGSVSVRLSAATPQGAAHLSTWLPELKTSLEQADLVTGELSAVLAQPAEAPAQSQSYAL